MSLLDVIARRASDEPRRTAFVYEKEEFSFEDLWQAVRRFAGLCRERGLARGERVVLALPNGLDFFAAFYGIQCAGGVAVPLYPGSGIERLRAVASLCEARAIVRPSSVTSTNDHGNGLGSDFAVWTVEESSLLDPVSHAVEIGGEETSFIQYTSGSTADPKGVELTHGGLMTNIDQLVAGFEIVPEDVFVSWLPVYHDMGLILMTMVPFSVGNKLFLLPTGGRGLKSWFEVISEHRGTFTAAPDFAYRNSLRLTKRMTVPDVSSLRVALNAAENVRAATIADFEQTFEVADVMTPAYGLAEATVGVSTWPVGHPTKADARGFVSVGRPFPEVEIHIRRDGEPATAGEVGEILVRSPALCRGYHNNAEATASLFRQGGFIGTGDLGYRDDEGDLFIVGRSKEIIIQMGETLSPQEVEEAVEGLSFVRSSAAIGLDRGRIEGEQVYLFAEVRTSKSASEDSFSEMIVEIVGAIRNRLGFRPGRVYLVKPKTLPRTANGKLRRGELKRMYMDGTLGRSESILFPDF